MDSKKGGRKALLIAGSILAAALLCIIGAWICRINTTDSTASENTIELAEVPVPKSGSLKSTDQPHESTDVQTKGTQTFAGGTTILVYIVGSNLESESGCATLDIDEMMNAKFGNDINLIVETGGSVKWYASEVDGKVIDSKYVQRYRVKSGSKELIENVKLADMGTPSTLTEFLKWGVSNYPAERYVAILWDHGGGTIGSYGSDSIYSTATYSSGIDVYELRKAFADSGCHFDIIGFDACLMATFENAYALSDCADYLLASEETEWGYGWYYTDWLNKLGTTPSMSTVDLGKNIVDSYANQIDRYNSATGQNVAYTLSFSDLKKTNAVYTVITDCFAKAEKSIEAGGFNKLSQARADATFYGGGSEKAPQGVYAQIDVADFMNKAGLFTGTQEKTLCRDFVLYERNNIGNSNGIAMYFPYTLALKDYAGSYPTVAGQMKKIGYDDSYFKFFDSFVSVIANINGESFTPQYTGETAHQNETAAQQNVIDSNKYTEPVLDENGHLPMKIGENGYYEIDLSVQPEGFVNSITSIWSQTYADIDDELWEVMVTPGTYEVGHNNLIPYGGQSLRPYPYMYSLEGVLTSLRYYSENFLGETYYVDAVVNGEKAAIFLDFTIRKVPDHISGEVVPSTKTWKLRGYTTTFNDGIPDFRSARNFVAGDKICSYYRSIQGKEYKTAEESQIHVAESPYSIGIDYDGWNYPSCVVNTVIDSSGKRHYAYAFYPGGDGSYSKYYENGSFTAQHKIENKRN